jgi:predicted fused transcriptional regulator/phosphomethylpyrimidine kinase
VKLNLAYALPGAKTKDQVASFPNRLPDHQGRIGEPRPPEFGSSRHLSSVLLAASKGRHSISAVMNTRSGPDVFSALRAIGEEVAILDRAKQTIEGFLSEEGTLKTPFIVDPGDFGIEPCLYIFGTSPLEVVHRAFELHQALKVNERGTNE